MNFTTLTAWDEALWREAEPIYRAGFPLPGRKTRAMIKKIIDTEAGFVHLGNEGGRTVAMAVTGLLPDIEALLIDYAAVRPTDRGRGVGRKLIASIAEEARRLALRGLVIEIEAEPTAANARRETFWTSLGFVRTEYVHRYRWVPEPYRALYLELRPADAPLPRDGETLFRSITAFHGKIYRN